MGTARSSPFFSSSADLSAYLQHKEQEGMRLGTNSVRQVLENLGLVRPPCCVVQVLGTNGKGSTCTFLHTLAQAHGVPTGLYTSPFFISPCNGILLQGRALDESLWLQAASAVVEAGGDALSYFEFVTAAAMAAFIAAGVELIILEAGLGGKGDATTAVQADLTLITPIAYDHLAVLGGSLEAIAANKAGAIRQGTPVLSAVQEPEVRNILAAQAARQKAVFYEVEPCFASCPSLNVPVTKESMRHIKVQLGAKPEAAESTSPSCQTAKPLLLGLSGAHQYGNAALALVGWRVIAGMLPSCCAKYTVSDPSAFDALFTQQEQFAALEVTCREQGALGQSFLPGRLQWVPPKSETFYGNLRQGGAPEMVQSAADPQQKRKVDSLFSRPLQVEEEKLRGAFPCVKGWPPMLLDGAHNAHAFAALGLALAQQKIAPLAIIISCLQDKDIPQLVPHIRSFATGIIFVTPIANPPRPCMPPEELAALLGVNAYPVASLEEALCYATHSMLERMPEVFEQEVCKHPLLVCGSLYLLDELYSLRPELLQ